MNSACSRFCTNFLRAPGTSTPAISGSAFQTTCRVGLARSRARFLWCAGKLSGKNSPVIVAAGFFSQAERTTDHRFLWEADPEQTRKAEIHSEFCRPDCPAQYLPTRWAPA